MSRSIAIGVVLVALSVFCVPAWAAGGSYSGGSSGGGATMPRPQTSAPPSSRAPRTIDDPDRTAAVEQALETIRELVAAEDYVKVVEATQRFLQRVPNNADGWNYRGFALRKLGQFGPAYEAYSRALRLNPRHLGAHEYLGEMYVQLGQMDLAQRQLQTLTQLCGRCEEALDLAAAMAAAGR